MGFFTDSSEESAELFWELFRFSATESGAPGTYEQGSRCPTMSGNLASSLAVLPAMWAERPTILLVEDEVIIRMMLADELRGRGFNVVEAQNADEALTLLQSRAPVGLVLTDVQLPGSMDGIALARLLRATRPELKVVIASGNISFAPGGDIAHAFFVKPYKPDDIVKCAEALLGAA